MTATPPELTLDRIATPVGEVLIVTDAGGCVLALDFHDYEPRMRRLLARHHGNVRLTVGRAPAPVREAIGAYFAGQLDGLTGLTLRTGGTAFQNMVWHALREIPPGRTETYGQLAARIGRPTAVRAVGLANGANPNGIIVPCHRVVGVRGALTGYAGGVERKRWLLAHEQAATASAAA